MPSHRSHRYTGPLKAVVLDWAGTIVDFGCIAPAAAFMQAFAEAGVPITTAEARAPMGLPKWDHIKAILSSDAVAARWQATLGRRPDDGDIEKLYDRFVPLQVQTVADHSELIPGALEAIAAMRARGLSIATTTGYPREVMDVVVREAKQQGFEPDVTICAGDTPTGRPGPFMALQALIRLSISPVEAVVKIGDTVVDIEEGLNGGMWSVGVAATGNEVGLSAADYAALPAEERQRLCAAATDVLLGAGAHEVVDSIGDVASVLDSLEKRLQAGDKP
ncbi:MAG TPA: phosphonoacetaldehyde hydrolase [Acidimicrobiales bacterium]|nr:phosphonoacetaldehyde hydrolase [Acidimicrobiales bacterium]